MFILFAALFGIGIFGGAFVKYRILGVPVTYLVMGALIISYVRYFVVKKGLLSLKKGEKSLLIFEIYGLIMTVLSFFGLNLYFISDDLYSSAAYIPRQAYYLLFLPSIILFQDTYYTEKFDKLIQKYGNYIFWIVYFSHMLAAQRFALSVPTEMLLCWLALCIGGTKRTKGNLIKFLALVFTPIPLGGELTNLIIRVLYLVYFIFHKKYGNAIFHYMAIGTFVMIAGILILPFCGDFFATVFDKNSFWRLNYWKDELTELAKTHFLGVGYGTSYASINFVGSSLSISGGPFAASAEYSTLDKLFVTGPHSSFIAIAFRLGIIGFITFTQFIKGIYKDLISPRLEITPATAFAFIASIIIIAVNVGLESPYYLIMFVFSMGRCAQEAKIIQEGQSML